MLVTTRFAPRRRAGPILLTSVAVFGVSMLVFGFSTSFLLSLAALFVSGVADGISVVIRMVILRVESPEAMRGRIASVNYVFIGASNELGALESGVAATIFGVVPSIVGGGLITLGVVAAVAVFAPQLRRLDLGERMRNGPGAGPQVPDGTTAAADAAELRAAEAAEVERLASGELGGEGAAIQR
jgi:MFS family permease